MRALAREAGITPTTIEYIETTRTVPTVASVEVLAKALEVSVCWLGFKI